QCYRRPDRLRSVVFRYYPGLCSWARLYPSITPTVNWKSAHFGANLGHQLQGSSFIVLKCGHPFLRPIFVAVDQVGRIDERDSASFEFGLGGVDVRHAQVENRLADKITFLFRQHQSHASEIEEGEVAE